MNERSQPTAYQEDRAARLDHAARREALLRGGGTAEDSSGRAILLRGVAKVRRSLVEDLERTGDVGARYAEQVLYYAARALVEEAEACLPDDEG